MLEIVIAFFTDNAVVLGAIGGLSGAATVVWAILTKPFKRTKPTELDPKTIEQLKPAMPTTVPALTVPEFIRLRRALKEDLEEEFQTANAAEKELLQAQIADLQSQINDPEPALTEAKKQIADLEERLARMGNDVGGDRLAEAREAFKRLDYSVADEIFAEVEERQKLQVQQAARAAFGRGEIAEAEVRWLDAADHYERAARLDPNYETLGHAGHFLYRAGRHRDAIHCGEQLVEISREEFGDEHENTGKALNNLAECYRVDGEYNKAEPMAREALKITGVALGKEHPVYAVRLTVLALLLKTMRRYDEAEPLYREALEIDRKTLGEAHPDYAIDLNNLAGLLEATGRYDEAEPLYRKGLEIGRKTLGEAHPSFAIRLNNLARLLDATGRYEEAEPLYRAALSVFEAALGADHPSTQTVAQNLETFLADRSDTP